MHTPNAKKEGEGIARGQGEFIHPRIAHWVQCLTAALGTGQDPLRTLAQLVCKWNAAERPDEEELEIVRSIARVCQEPPLRLSWIGFYIQEGENFRAVELPRSEGEPLLPPLPYSRFVQGLADADLLMERFDCAPWLPLHLFLDPSENREEFCQIRLLPLLVLGRMVGLVCLLAPEARRCVEDNLVVHLMIACAPLSLWWALRGPGIGGDREETNSSQWSASRLDRKDVSSRGSLKPLVFPELVGESSSFLHALALAQRWAAGRAPILITGETGTGKELLARAIHALSPRRGGPWVAVNCPAIPRELAESELFGHEKGAFTGATEARPGRFERADGGVLFLDEVGDLPATIQAKLLRVLQEGEIERVGSARAKKVDVRVIAATNRDLNEAVRLGDFRRDLYHRLAALPIHLPPLRERIGDIDLLAWHFLQKSCDRYGKRIDGMAPGVLEKLKAYDWPGNVRELEYVIERAVLLAGGPFLQVEHLADLEAGQGLVGLSLNAQLRVEKLKRVEATLRQTQGNCAEAARLLGMSRGNFARLLKCLRIDPRRFRLE
ncbi:MAG: sigma-54 dependent transcriptional regulator [Candidatus Binatia bacterium]|nr:sigma-54 dependent transcriptional regulator [Candidatus Binatia bacterium]